MMSNYSLICLTFVRSKYTTTTHYLEEEGLTSQSLYHKHYITLQHTTLFDDTQARVSHRLTSC